MKLHFPTENNFSGTINSFSKNLFFYTDAIELNYFAVAVLVRYLMKKTCEHCVGVGLHMSL